MTPPLPSSPFVSVILAIRNEASFIERTLSAILQQDFPRESMEILIADGQSSDATREVIGAVASKTPEAAVTVIDNPKRFVSAGLNAALAGARGDVIVRVDGHTIIEPDYVRQCVEALQRTGAENVGGRMDPIGTTPFGRAVALATSSPFGVGGARFHYSTREEWVDTVYLGAWPRAVFTAIGGFDEEQVRNQDDELNYRLRERGGRVLLTPQIRSKYFNRGTVGSLWRQYYEYGFWKVRVMQKHPRQMQLRQFVPACFVAGLATLAIASPFHILPRMLLGTVTVLYTASSALAAAKVSPKKQDGPLRPMIAFSFAVLHVAYGAGFLAGLVRFRTGWRSKRHGSGSKTNVPNCGAV